MGIFYVKKYSIYFIYIITTAHNKRSSLFSFFRSPNSNNNNNTTTHKNEKKRKKKKIKFKFLNWKDGRFVSMDYGQQYEQYEQQRCGCISFPFFRSHESNNNKKRKKTKKRIQIQIFERWAIRLWTAVRAVIRAATVRVSFTSAKIFLKKMRQRRIIRIVRITTESKT